MRRFIAKQDFFSPELRSQYLAGMRYTVRDGNDLLAENAEKWAQEGKIEFIDEEQAAGVAPATVGGVGTVG